MGEPFRRFRLRKLFHFVRKVDPVRGAQNNKLLLIYRRARENQFPQNQKQQIPASLGKAVPAERKNNKLSLIYRRAREKQFPQNQKQQIPASSGKAVPAERKTINYCLFTVENERNNFYKPKTTNPRFVGKSGPRGAKNNKLPQKPHKKQNPRPSPDGDGRGPLQQ